MKKLFLFTLLCMAATLSQAQTQVPDDGLYKALGEKSGLVRLMDDFIPRLVADPRIGPFFKRVDRQHLAQQLVDQFCELSGGPCKYAGGSMTAVHKNMQINRTDFNALVEVLQESMQAQGIAFSTQNQLLALLAPMYRSIIETEK